MSRVAVALTTESAAESVSFGVGGAASVCLFRWHFVSWSECRRSSKTEAYFHTDQSRQGAPRKRGQCSGLVSTFYNSLKQNLGLPTGLLPVQSCLRRGELSMHCTWPSHFSYWVWLTSYHLMLRIFQTQCMWKVLSRHSWCLYVVQASQLHRSVLSIHASWMRTLVLINWCLLSHTLLMSLPKVVAALPIMLLISSKETQETHLGARADKYLHTLKPSAIKQNLDCDFHVIIQSLN